MHLHCHIFTRASFHHCNFSYFVVVVLHHHEPPKLPPLTYLPGFPRPGPKYDETILAIPRTMSGKNIYAKERKAGHISSIVFNHEDSQHSGNKRLISVGTNQIRKLVNHLGCSLFLS